MYYLLYGYSIITFSCSLTYTTEKRKSMSDIPKITHSNNDKQINCRQALKNALLNALMWID